jgi:hypothetical protein
MHIAGPAVEKLTVSSATQHVARMALDRITQAPAGGPGARSRGLTPTPEAASYPMAPHASDAGSDGFDTC